MDGEMNEIEVLEDFFHRTDSNALFDFSGPGRGRIPREGVKDALIEALVWRRAELEGGK
ncbi:MAG: hypothetical protein GY859_42775, partial [Desulfobacterales bacterium]|nr:hypothetical protein [Desulfobacterales bacterium]